MELKVVWYRVRETISYHLPPTPAPQPMQLRDCSLFMAKGGWGSVIFNQFRHMKNLSHPKSGYFKKLPTRLCDSFKILPPLPYPWDATCLQLRNCVQHVFWPRVDKPKSSARSFVIVQHGSTQQGK